jgi:hypothetical protein
MNFNEMAYGAKEHRRAPRRSRGSDEITELGHEAIRGVVTVGVVGATASLVGGVLGSFPKP